MSQARFQKRMREKARQEKAQAKRERKEERVAQAQADAERDAPPAASQDEVLAQLADLHKQFETDAIEFEEFEELKQELLAKLDV
jgi:hypothetical protein